MYWITLMAVLPAILHGAPSTRNSCNSIGPYGMNVNGTCSYLFSYFKFTKASTEAFCQGQNAQLGPRLTDTRTLESFINRGCGDLHTAYSYDPSKDDLVVDGNIVSKTMYSWRNSSRPSAEMPIIIATIVNESLVVYPEVTNAKYLGMCIEDPCVDKTCGDGSDCSPIKNFCGYECKALETRTAPSTTEASRTTLLFSNSLPLTTQTNTDAATTQTTTIASTTFENSRRPTSSETKFVTSVVFVALAAILAVIVAILMIILLWMCLNNTQRNTVDSSTLTDIHNSRTPIASRAHT